MSDIDNFSDSEKLTEIVYYNGNDKDVYIYLQYFEANYPLCSKDIDSEVMKEHIESDHNHFISVVTSFLLYEWDLIRDVIRIERNLNTLSIEDRKLLGIIDFEDDINELRKCISINQNFLKLMLSPDLYYELIYNNKNAINLCIDNKKKCFEQKLNGLNVNNNDLENNELSDISKELNLNDLNLNLQNNNLTQKQENLKNKREENQYNLTEVIRDISEYTENVIQSNSENFQYEEINYNKIPNTTLNNLCKVKATLRQFVRDWSEEGRSERSESYNPIIQALLKYLPLKSGDSQKKKVLIPGAGLGRVLFEVARLGYICQGNEISYAMLLGSNFVLNYMFKENSITIYPYVLSLSNRPKKKDHLRPVLIPDICVSSHIKPDHDLSMCAGEFVEVYSKQKQAWDGILTCFFLDTARNIITYIRTITNLLSPNGVWINMGPLLYHYSGMNDVISIELSWEEIRKIISKYFEIVEEEWKDASYIRNDHSMFRVVYKCIFFVAIRNKVLLE